MSANVEAMVREGAAALKAGRKDEARALLSKAVELDPYNEEGWLWLSGIVELPEDQRTCLENVLAINPNNQRAQQGLAYLSRKPAAPPTPAPPPAAPPPPPAAPPAAPPTAPPAAPAFSSDPFSGLGGFADAFSAGETSGWDDSGMETSSASSYRPVNEPTGEVLDDWVSGLGIGGDNRTAAPSSSAFTTTSPFTEVSFGTDDAEEDDPFASGPFAGATFAPEPPAPAASPSRPTPPRPSEPPPPASSGRLSPTFDDGMADLRGAADMSSGLNQFASAFPSDFTPMNDANFTDAESQDNFSLIPIEIKATRIPGTDGDRPRGLVAAVVLLAILNLGAGMLAMLRLLG